VKKNTSIDSFKNLHGLSNEELGKLLGLSKSKIQAFETAEHPEWLTLALKGLEIQLKTQRLTQQPNDNTKFKFIDLFAGIGGMRTAFEKAGGACVFTSEWDKYPAKMYEDNFGEKPAGDITKIDAKDIPVHDILVAGFPCQPFSIAGVSKKKSLGRAHGFEDKTQGTLFFDVARIIHHHRPKMFLLENVKNLKSHDKGNTFRVILETLEKDLGYKIEVRVIDAKSLVPQHRERVYIVGTRDMDSDFQFPVIKPKQTCLDDILFKDSDVDKRYTLSDKLWAGLQRHAANHKAKGNGFGFGLCTRADTARTLSARYYKDGSEILIKQKNKNPRRLTPRECARLMGFQENYKITLSDTRAYKCFGNSVVVPVVEKIAKAMINSNSFKNVSTYQKINSGNEYQTSMMN
jgi:DNA (cytosine-5)-methyltransferase 1